MLTDQIQKLAAAKAKVTALELKLASELKAALAALPTEFGFEDVSSFVTAVREAAGKRRGRKAGAKAAAPTVIKKRRRAKITEATRAKVKALVEAGKTGGAIARKLKISLPSVQNIKKALGLVKNTAKK